MRILGFNTTGSQLFLGFYTTEGRTPLLQKLSFFISTTKNKTQKKKKKKKKKKKHAFYVVVLLLLVFFVGGVTEERKRKTPMHRLLLLRRRIGSLLVSSTAPSSSPSSSSSSSTSSSMRETGALVARRCLSSMMRGSGVQASRASATSARSAALASFSNGSKGVWPPRMSSRYMNTSTTLLSKNTGGEQEQPREGDGEAAATEGGETKEKEGNEQEQEGEEEDDQNEMAEKDALIVELNERHLRTLADMENLRTRTQRQNEDAKKFAVQGFAKDLLDVADNIDRACATVTEEIIAEAKNDAGKLETLLRSFKEGVELTQRQLSSGFKKHGLVKFDPVDEPFDANEHMALFNVPVGETKKEPGSVAVVTKAGYRLHDRVVRAAEVGVYQ